MSKINSFREKLMYIKQHKINSLQQLAENADIFDKSYTGPSYNGHEPQQDDRFNSNNTSDMNRGSGNRYFGKTFNPDGTRHRNWAADNSNQNSNRGQEQKQSQNRMYNSRAINAVALDKRNSRQNKKSNYCSRTNHTENQCYYKPVNMQNNSRNSQDGQFRNQGNQSNGMTRRNENVRYIDEQEIDGDFERPGITFNRESDFPLDNGNNQKETIMKERKENNRGEYNVYATFVEGFDNCEDSTWYGRINRIPSKIIRDTGASCSFISSKLVKKENYTGEKVTVVFAEGKSQVKPVAMVPVTTPFYTGRLKCIVSEGAKHDLLLGNYNGNQKIGGCQFNRLFNDRNVKEVYDKRVKSENVRKNVAMESSRQKEYINYVSVETRKDKCNEKQKARKS